MVSGLMGACSPDTQAHYGYGPLPGGEGGDVLAGGLNLPGVIGLVPGQPLN